MSTRTFALAFGAVFLVFGLSGFVPALVQPLHPGHPDTMGNSGQLFGLFPVNALHNLVHALFGIWGLAASRSPRASVAYARTVAIVYALLTVAGVIPGPETMFGLLPLYGNDIWFHALLALIGAYFGWVHRNPDPAGVPLR